MNIQANTLYPLLPQSSVLKRGLVFILSREASKHPESSVVAGITLCKLAFLVWATKTLAMASELGYCVYVFMNTISD